MKVAADTRSLHANESLLQPVSNCVRSLLRVRHHMQRAVTRRQNDILLLGCDHHATDRAVAAQVDSPDACEILGVPEGEQTRVAARDQDHACRVGGLVWRQEGVS